MRKTIEDLFRPVAPKRASDAIAEQIKEMIYTGVLKPDDRLPSERELAATMQTGRMTVREALRMLEESGFIVVRQGAEGGTFIRELDGSGMTKSITDLVKVGNISLQELTEARVAIETIIIESLIPDISDEQLTLLQNNLEQCASAPPKKIDGACKNGRQFINFHLLLASFTQNRLFRYFLQSMIDFSTNFIRQYAPFYISREDHLSQHQNIFEALKSRDLERSREALKYHLYAVSQNVDIAMQSSRKKEASV